MKILCRKLFDFDGIDVYYLISNTVYIIALGHYFEIHDWYLFSRNVIVMQMFCCNTAVGFHGLSTFGWHTAEMLRHAEQSRCDTHIETEPLRQRILFKFSHWELSIYISKYSSSTCLWSIYLSVDPIFQRSWFLYIMISLIAGCC